MPHYTVHVLGRDGRRGRTVSFDGDDDEHAIALVIRASFAAGGPVELREGARLVRRFRPDGSLADPPPGDVRRHR